MNSGGVICSAYYYIMYNYLVKVKSKYMSKITNQSTAHEGMVFSDPDAASTTMLVRN